MSDTSAIKSHDATIEIKHPATDEPIGLRLTLRAKDNPEIKKLERKFINQSQQLRLRSKAFKAEDMEENSLELTMAIISGWEWYAPNPENPDDVATFHDAVPEFNPKNVRAVLTELEWINPQVDEAWGNDKLFFQN